MLKIAESLSLPVSAATQTFGFFGRKGSGKTYAAGKLVEAFLATGVQVVVLDPVGNWFGLRLDKSGKHPSRFPLPILGGEHGDVPLATGGGPILADFLVSTGSSAVVDVSGFRKNDRKEFVTHFAEQLFHRKKSARTPMHVVLEEAQVFAPQQYKGQERMLGAIEDIVRLGRNYGIGCSMISQRPQSVNTEIRNQCEPLVIFQLVAKHERDAVGNWMEHMGVETDLEALARLQTGECFFWSPAWLDKFVKTRFLPKETYDASSTPEVGRKQHEPAKLAPVDLEKLNAAMAATIEQAKADNPKLLKQELAQLKQQLKQLEAQPAKTETQEVSVVKADDRQLMKSVAARIEKSLTAISKAFENTAAMLDDVRKLVDLVHLRLDAAAAPKPSPLLPLPKVQVTPRPVQPRPILVAKPLAVSPAENVSLKEPHIRILRSLYWQREDFDVTPERVAFLAKYTVNGHFNNVLGNLRAAGLVQGWKLTDAGLVVAAKYTPDDRPTGAALREWFRSKLSGPENRLVDVAFAAGGEPVPVHELAERAGYTVNGHFNNLLGHLRSIGVLEGGVRDGGVRIHTLFLE